MKFRYLIFSLILLCTYSVSGLKSNSPDLINRNICSKYELAYANNDGSITKIECFDTYKLAKEKMNSDVNNEENNYDNEIILERENNVTRIIDAKYAIAKLDKGKDALTYLYSKSNATGSSTYMNNYSAYGAVDAAFIEYDGNYQSVKVRLGGITGWIKKGEYKIIPLSWMKETSFYKIDDKGIYHYYTKDIEDNKTQSYRSLGPKPSNINNGNYYSYDGIYLYSDYKLMITDYRNNSHNNANNKDNPYYNYYLYLSHRSKTNYSIDDLDSYVRNVLNYNGSIYGKSLASKKSLLYGSSEYFMYDEDMYGANALMVFSLSRNESANGTSKIAYTKNNIFGHNAIDGAAYSSATGYLDVRSSIYTHGYGYVNYGYAEVADSRYYGSHFGNKYRGMNVMYASDVYWGEKAANYYYLFDKDNGMLDYNYYQLVISNTSNVNVRVAPNTNSSIVYTIKYQGLPFILLEEVEGEEYKGSKVWYKLQADSNIDNNGKIIKTNSSWPKYNWNGTVYVHSSFLNKINDAKTNDGKYHRPSDIKTVNGTIKTYADSAKFNPIVAKATTDINYYYTSSLLEKKGVIKKDSIIVILEEINDGEDNLYHIITNFGTVDKSWISQDGIEIINCDLVKVDINESGKYINVVDKNNKNLLNVYTGSFLPIIDKELIGNKLYLKVEYNINGIIQNGYIDSTIDNISYTLNNLENKDSIVPPQENEQEEKINPDDIKEIEEKITKELENYVIKDMSDSLFMFNSLKHISGNTFNVSGFMGIRGMDNRNVSNYLIFYNEITEQEYIFELDRWKEFPYSMSCMDDDKEYYYDDGWFNSNIDLSELPNGDYKVMVIVKNNNYFGGAFFTNIAYMDMTRRAKGNNKEFLIDVDYTTLYSPLLFSVRETLISLDVPKSIDPMYNFFNEISLSIDTLKIKGTSHNYGISYGKNDDVKRYLVLENINNYQRYELELGSITNGDYPITLAVSDNMDKTKAWFNNSVNLSNIPKGKYVLYIKNIVNNITYYGEVIDVSYTDFSKINNDKYHLSRNDDIRLRIEMEIK